jgi:hypothetical protein
MASEPSTTVAAEPVEVGRRLGDQLHALSQVAETLTYRLLDLEEKLAAQEQTLRSLIGSAMGSDPEQVEQMEQRLGETEARLIHLEELLADGEPPAAVRRLQALPTAVAGRLSAEPAMMRETLADDDMLDEPFPEEAEQPFMDERIA